MAPSVGIVDFYTDEGTTRRRLQGLLPFAVAKAELCGLVACRRLDHQNMRDATLIHAILG